MAASTANIRLVLLAAVMRFAPLREDGEGVDESVGLRFELSVVVAAGFGVVLCKAPQ
jgi:hypothetical protein